MRMATKRLHLVVAHDKHFGIGYQGKLPWPRLKTDMKFMRKITTETKDQSKQNAVVFGRRTWESIPTGFRPLKNRYNVVLSSRPSADIPGAHLVSPSLTVAMETLHTSPLSEQIELVYILGGARVYEEAMLSPYCDKLYITEVLGEFPADTYMPPIDHSLFKPVEDDAVPKGIIEENGVKYKFTVLQKLIDSSC